MIARNDTVKTLPVPVAGSARMDAGFAAQLLGSGGQRRGLKGGPPVLAEARSAYLRTEWSGTADRRPPAGGVRAMRV